MQSHMNTQGINSRLIGRIKLQKYAPAVLCMILQLTEGVVQLMLFATPRQ